MRIEDLRHNFTVYLLADTVDQGIECRNHLAQYGYDAFQFSDERPLLAEMERSLPHVLVFSMNSMFGDLKSFVEKVYTLSREVVLIPLFKIEQTKKVFPFKPFGVAPPIIYGEGLTDRVLWSVDEACEKIYLNYQNEELYKQTNSESKTKDYEELIVELKTAQSKEELLDRFLYILSQKISGFRGIFFRFLPTVNSFVATHSFGVEIDSMRGIGSPILSDEIKNLHQTLVSNLVPHSLREFIEKGIQITNYASRPLVFEKHIEGTFLFWSTVSPIDFRLIETEFLIFHLVFNNYYLTKKLEQVDFVDNSTQLMNKKTYQKRLEEELSRARRSKIPLSLIRLKIDHWDEVEKNLGAVNRDLVLKSVANVVRRGSRTQDSAARTDEDELTLILPNCDSQGALMRAERLRRAVEENSFTLSGARITLSLGVGEYPSLCRNQLELEDGVKKAIGLTVQKGGNKVCLYKPSGNFTPEFTFTPSK